MDTVVGMDTGYTQVEGTVKNDLFLSGQFITRTKAIMNTFLLVYQGLLLLLVFFIVTSAL